MTTERSPVLPEPADRRASRACDVQAYTCNSLFLPKGAPADVVKMLNKAAAGAINTPAVKERLQGLGRRMVGQERQSRLARQIRQSEIKKWEAPIKASGVQVE